ncbi:heparan-alpha-glucosaminide N-acetyltransferase domain-containing protein [uncultured Rhodoblastus sp.]|uniref:heparan-alpha-glucosaminide N-acetyltransferase domain-containing protein n=1 Tax=uncultured Rhodoblastus sp. TaxID=543037 RepID=UPI0025E57812|nr:heparan-alpha-glucosaminide N-acetyltransferase domain-containing protein [uncultured Rhodoblastus sp.]
MSDNLPGRELWIDAVRGLAICVMAPANMAPMLIEPHPWVFRFIWSMAAPTFVIIAGMMVALTASRNSLGHYILHGMVLVLCGALVDIVAYRFLPFTTCDVLYLIGISLPFVYLANRLSWKWIAGISVVIFSLTPALQQWLGYTRMPPIYGLSGHMITDRDLVTTGILNHYVVDGYFPIFPWTGLMLLGTLLQRLHWGEAASAERWKNQQALPTAVALVVVGGIVWRIWPGRLLERAGYAEMFYNPTIGFILTAVGCFLIVYRVAFYSQFSHFWSPLRVLGESSLFMYMFHLVVIGEVFENWYPDPIGPWQFGLMWPLLLVAMVLLGCALRHVKARCKEMPYVLRFVLGA